MILQKIDESTFPLAEEFVIPHEEKCVFLTTKIRKKDQNIYFLLKGNQKKFSISEILGIIYINSSIFHCIPNLKAVNEFELKNQIDRILHADFHNSKNAEIRCISGEKEGTDFLINLLNEKKGQPYQINHYKLMTCSKVINQHENLSNDDKIIRCTQSDIENLFAIQKKYLTEEVAPYGKKVSDAEVSIGLRQILKNQFCLALYSDGEIVAKANTNAIGLNYVQLGGVYTSPLFRRNGYAWHLISAICRRTQKAGKKAALFVKDINVPAIELYKKVGFLECGKYEIAYYEK